MDYIDNNITIQESEQKLLQQLQAYQSDVKYL